MATMFARKKMQPDSHTFLLIAVLQKKEAPARSVSEEEHLTLFAIDLNGKLTSKNFLPRGHHHSCGCVEWIMNHLSSHSFA